MGRIAASRTQRQVFHRRKPDAVWAQKAPNQAHITAAPDATISETFRVAFHDCDEISLGGCHMVASVMSQKQIISLIIRYYNLK